MLLDQLVRLVFRLASAAAEALIGLLLLILFFAGLGPLAHSHVIIGLIVLIGVVWFLASAKKNKSGS